MHLDHLLEPRGFVHVVLMLCLSISLAFGVMWGADVAQLYCLQSVPWNEGISSLGYATCLWEAIGCILFLRNAFDMMLIVAYYDEDGHALLTKRRKKLHALIRQCKESLVRMQRIMGDMQMKRIEDMASLINLHITDQQDILVDLRRSWKDAEQGNWESPDAQQIFHTLVVQMAEYMDEPNRLVASMQLMTPPKGKLFEDEADQEQDEWLERMEQIVRFLLSDPSLTDQQNPVIERWKSSQLWKRKPLESLRGSCKEIASFMFFCLGSMCMCSVSMMATNESSRGLVVFDDEEDLKATMQARMLTRDFTKNVSNASQESLWQDAGMYVLAPVRTAIQSINHIKIDEDYEDHEQGIPKVPQAPTLRWFGMGSPFAEHENLAGVYPRTVRCGCLWVRILSRVHRRLLLGVCVTFIYLLIYALIFKRLFEDIFVIDGSKCRDSAEKNWECKVALVRRLFGITALVIYLGTVVFILGHFDRFDNVMQVEMDILELQDFKMDMEALDSEMFGVSDEASGLLDEVKARLQRRLRIMQKFKRNRNAKTLPEYEALSKRLATATEELQELDRRRRGNKEAEKSQVAKPSGDDATQDWSFKASYDHKDATTGHTKKRGGDAALFRSLCCAVKGVPPAAE